MNTPPLTLVDLHAFGVRRAVRIAATNRGVEHAGAERLAMDHLRLHGDRTGAILAALAQLRRSDCHQAG